MLRDRSGHSSTIILSWRWRATGRDPGGFACWFRWFPGWLSWCLCLTTCVTPARCHPVQLTSQAGSTQCHALLISYSIKVICTWLCTRYVHKKVQSSIVYTSEVSLFLVSVCAAFSLCSLRAVLYFLPFAFCLTKEISQNRGTRTHTLNSRTKSKIKMFWFSELKLLLVIYLSPLPVLGNLT